LISQVADEIWICEKQTVTKWNGSIVEYKNLLKDNVLGTDGKKTDMTAASADHYHKEEPAPVKKKEPAPVKKMQILSISTNKKPSPASSPKVNGGPSPPKTNGGGKFVPPGKRNQTANGNGDSQKNGDDWW